MRMTTDHLLSVRNLTVSLQTPSGTVNAVDGVSFDIARGEVLGLVGESGCGKTLTMLSLVQLLPSGVATISAGSIRFEGEELVGAPVSVLQRVRGGRIGMIFQDPMTSLNPTMSVGRQIAEGARVHLGLTRKQGSDRAAELLDRCGISSAREKLGYFPHQFSGGMRQRVVIAMALACNPQLLLADEPTTALDTTVQAQILDLIQDVSEEFGMSVMLVTHDMGVAARLCDGLNVMYAGRLVESGPAMTVFERPAMPYTDALLQCMPRLDSDPDARPRPIAGKLPAVGSLRQQCSFAPRCSFAREVCTAGVPSLTERGKDHAARCFGTEEEGWIAL